MGLIYLDGDDDEISRRVECTGSPSDTSLGVPRMSRAVRQVRPRTWAQQEERDGQAHICRKCGGLIPAGRLHLRITNGGGYGDPPFFREHLHDCPPKTPRGEDARWASGIVFLVAVAGMLVLVACAFLRAMR